MVLDIFKFLRKKPEVEEEKGQKEIKTPEQLANDSKEKVTFDQGVTIHTMPEHYRFKHVKVDNARTMGFFIIFLGLIVLAGVSTLLYFYLFKTKPQQNQPTGQIVATNTAATSQEEAELNETINASGNITEPAITTPSASLKIEEENPMASSTEATTTPELINEPLAFIIGADSDNDGLTDKEEILIGTNPKISDTNNNGYNDLTELLNLYNPVGSGKITADQEIAAYINDTFNYSLLYPKALSISTNGGDDSVMFKTADNQFIQVIIEPNALGRPIGDWFFEQFGDSEIDPAKAISGKDWTGIKSSDDLIIYLTDSKLKYIYTLTYNPGSSNILEYKNIFKLMSNTFWTNN